MPAAGLRVSEVEMDAHFLLSGTIRSGDGKSIGFYSFFIVLTKIHEK